MQIGSPDVYFCPLHCQLPSKDEPVFNLDLPQYFHCYFMMHINSFPLYEMGRLCSPLRFCHGAANALCRLSIVVPTKSIK